MDNYSYIIGDMSSGLCALIDPAWEAPLLEKTASELGFKVDSLILTHGHPDHMNAAAELLSRHDVPLWVEEGDAFMLPAGIRKNIVKGDWAIPFGKSQIAVLHTPGHSPGSCCLLVDNSLLTGDTLFIGGCGRVDLPGSDTEQMWKSLVRLASLSNDLRVLPGHAYAKRRESTIASEKRHNPCIKLALKSREEFLKNMTA